MTTARKSKIWPVPEILDDKGKPFKLKETQTHGGAVCTNLIDRIMTVPTDDSPYGRMGRMHEMAHVAITPTDGIQMARDRAIKEEYIQVVEDMRVHMFLEDRRFTLEPSLPEELMAHRAKGYVLEKDFKTAALMAVASYRLPEYEQMLDMFDYEWSSRIRSIVDECNRFIKDNRSFEGALQAARYLQDLLEDEEYVGKANVEPEAPGRGEKWGEMEILTPPLTQRLPQRKLNRRVRPNEYGGSLMFPQRLDDDGKIFGNTRRVAKGTVLVDVSGSMCLESYQIEELVKAIPGVTVAVYSGSKLEGHLTVIAKNGSMLKGEEMTDWPGGNVVDGPALKWLAKQAEPRVWVCDGHVTGIYDNDGPNLTREAREIQEKNKIKRTEYIDAAATLLKK